MGAEVCCIGKTGVFPIELDTQSEYNVHSSLFVGNMQRCDGQPVTWQHPKELAFDKESSAIHISEVGYPSNRSVCHTLIVIRTIFSTM